MFQFGSNSYATVALLIHLMYLISPLHNHLSVLIGLFLCGGGVSESNGDYSAFNISFEEGHPKNVLNIHNCHCTLLTFASCCQDGGSINVLASLLPPPKSSLLVPLCVCVCIFTQILHTKEIM